MKTTINSKYSLSLLAQMEEMLNSTYDKEIQKAIDDGYLKPIEENLGDARSFTVMKSGVILTDFIEGGIALYMCEDLEIPKRQKLNTE